MNKRQAVLSDLRFDLRALLNELAEGEEQTTVEAKQIVIDKAIAITEGILNRCAF